MGGQARHCLTMGTWAMERVLIWLAFWAAVLLVAAFTLGFLVGSA